MKTIQSIISFALLAMISIQLDAQNISSYDDYMNAASKSLEMGDYTMTKLLCADAMIKDITRPEAYIYTAIAFYKEDQLELAKEYINKALAWSDEDQKKYCAEILQSIRDKESFNQITADAKHYEKSKSYKDAVNSYYKAWKLFPVRADIGIKVAELYIKTTQYSKAMEVLNELKKYPDPQVKSMANALYKSLDNTSIIKNKKAVENHLANAERHMRNENYSSAISEYKKALKYKYNDFTIKSKIKKAEEELAYQKAINSDYVTDSEKYADSYPNGKYIRTINDLIKRSYISIAKTYYNKSDENGLRRMYSDYQSRFPGDSGIDKIKYQLGTFYFNQAEREYTYKRWSNAKSYYNKYLDLYYYGGNSTTAKKKIKACTRKLNQRSSAFVAYSYEELSPIGISFGRLNKRGTGFYMNLKMNSDIFTGLDVLYTIDDSRNHDRPGTIVLLGEEKLGNVALSGGTTFKIFYPLYGFVGGGLGYYPYYEKVDVYFSNSGDYWEEDWLRNTDQTAFKLFPEVGSYLKLADAVVFKYGVMYQDGTFSHQLGFGFAY